MSERKFRVTIEDLNRNKKVNIDIEDEDIYKKPLLDIIVDHLFDSTISAPKQLHKGIVQPQKKTGTAVLINPSREDIEAFIKSKPNYEYSIEAVTEHFLGNERFKFDDKELKRWDSGLRIKVKRLTKAIAKSENGYWQDRHTEGHKKVFKFIKNNDKQSVLVSEDTQLTGEKY